MIRVQAEDFDVGAEMAALTGARKDIGAVVNFIGKVRDLEDGALSAMTLEHYPGMTEKMLTEIEQDAHRRWNLDATLIIHRYGTLDPGEEIVMVACAAAHRGDALESCTFLIDWLKTKAPFWKCEDTEDGEKWVSARDSDTEAAKRWEED